MQNKTLAYWIVGIVGVVLIVLIIRQIYVQNHGATTNNTAVTTTTAPQNNSTSTPATSTPAAVNSSPSGAASAAYQAALAIYQTNGYRIEISQCHGIPGKLTVTQGQKYMLDNRDNQAHTIKVGPYTYNLPAYGYEIVTAGVLGLNNLTCDGGGAGQINIEK